jgi:ParB-like chromosome segregation protein Spo0J
MSKKKTSEPEARDESVAGVRAPIALVYVEPSTLNPAPYNPRRMTDKQAHDLRESITRFGLADPLIVNNFPGRENVVVGGHQRLRIARELGMAKVPVVFVSLPEDKEQELNLRLNRNTGEWDWDMLANFDVDTLLEVGFDKGEVDAKFNVSTDGLDASTAEAPAHKCPACGHEFD